MEYRYDCGPSPCRGVDTVSERLYSELTLGQAVGVRPAGGHGDTPRLDANQSWPSAIGRLLVGAMLMLGGGFASGRWPSGPKYLLAPGLEPGDDCIAVYPPDHPDLGTLRLAEPAALTAGT